MAVKDYYELPKIGDPWPDEDISARGEIMEYAVTAWITNAMRSCAFGPFASREKAEECILILAARCNVDGASIAEAKGNTGTQIKTSEVSTRAHTVLRNVLLDNHLPDTWEALATLERETVASARNCGETTFREIVKALESRGLRFR